MVTMKTKIFSILYAVVMILALSACSDSNVSDLLLNGNCDVTALKADTYDGIINKAVQAVYHQKPIHEIPRMDNAELRELLLE